MQAISSKKVGYPPLSLHSIDTNIRLPQKLFNLFARATWNALKGSSFDNQGATIAREDIHRAYALACHYQKGSTGDKSNRQAAKPAIPAKYMHQDVTSSPATAGETASEALLKLLMDARAVDCDIDLSDSYSKHEDMADHDEVIQGKTRKLLAKNTAKPLLRGKTSPVIRSCILENIISLASVSSEELKEITGNMSSAMFAASAAHEDMAETSSVGEGATLLIKQIEESTAQNQDLHLRRRYITAAQDPQLDPKNPKVGDHLTLRAWQVERVSWMLHQEASNIKCGILNDSCGFGKIIQALSLVYFSALRQNENHRPTIIIANLSRLNVWIVEFKKHFDGLLQLYIFHGSETRSTTNTFKKTHTIADIDSVLAQHPRTDPSLSRVVVLTTWDMDHLTI
ncbi:hypothetical protein MGYG_08729 [Nannizzia gypsea CBS 118893]|uniref:SNF2 N-terminal domain-containing protein n=1 Tax=Arthroderma gypseum (strain ATCC MYA-4604 / CBS 118893) TaxID=535722 RepID=E4V6T9_ARTGP|nr:hypothetical protein MGYG_08729 [Nannizzia gypsea CBS 118893]EFQ96805.1 hypothetical protein MGYG_08729 [Nannizzia gypsea CBS 118893]